MCVHSCLCENDTHDNDTNDNDTNDDDEENNDATTHTTNTSIRIMRIISISIGIISSISIVLLRRQPHHVNKSIPSGKEDENEDHEEA